MQQLTLCGKILEGVGGRYDIEINAPDTPYHRTVLPAVAKGVFRHEHITPLPGDHVELLLTLSENGDNGTASSQNRSSAARSMVITDIRERKNALIRPPMANLDLLFVMCASGNPAPMPDTVDKLLLIAEQNHIKPVLVITKSELFPNTVQELEDIYRLTPYPVFSVSAKTGDGIEPFRTFLKEALPGTTAAFAGASGIGKSTLMNALFPHLSLETAEVSQKIGRGRHTTRKVSLFPLPDFGDGTYLADTPGFSMLDFVHFDFFDIEDLPFNFPEFRDHLGTCRYTKCTHRKEDGCSILRAMQNGEIAQSRHASYSALYDILKKKPTWQKKQTDPKK